jgi:Na+/H+ antiporter NhaD/arsenite permease-like protein
MYLAIIVVFILGYILIATEHLVHIDKAASALFTGVVCWALIALGHLNVEGGLSIEGEVMHHIGEIGGILFFLMGAMTIVELIDTYHGFTLITDKINSRNKIVLLWVLGAITFFMSAALDNLTTSIVMASLLRKIIKEKEDLWIFAGVIIIAANAGGAWTPIGDVTTIMLWIGGHLTAANVMLKLIVPSLVCLIIPLIYFSIKAKGNLGDKPVADHKEEKYHVSEFEKKTVFIVGVGALLFVPIFKTITHLPPFLGILFGLSVLWFVTEMFHFKLQDHLQKEGRSVASVLKKVDTSSILFFLGILLAVSALQTAGHLGDMSNILNESFKGNIFMMNGVIGVLSAIVDNVPLVAGAMGMYSGVYVVDHSFWELLAFCAGTGGSILIIGSAAGVAIMGILKIDFIWYAKKISLPALLGYLGGMLTFWLMFN